jgi:uncharacterized damage-inducible protein DinB
MDMLDRLLDFDHWAMDELFKVSEGLTDTQLDQAFDIGHRAVRATFEHLVWNIEFWARLMVGERMSEEPDQTGLSLKTLGDHYERNFEGFAALARRLRDEGRLEETYLDHWNVRKSMGGTILQVLLHASEHRTEIVHMLVRLGVQNPPEVDLGARDYELLNT